MSENRFYTLAPLPYGYDELDPYISKEQLTLHHDKHHQAYVNSANDILKQLDQVHQNGGDYDSKSLIKSLSFNLGGHILHSLFWKNLSPESKQPSSELTDTIKLNFGSFEQFEKEFSKAAVTVEGSGWASLAYDPRSERLIIGQIEKHNVNGYPGAQIIMVLDVWEHAYYLDYKNERAKFVEAFWNIVDWEEVERRLGEAMKKPF